MTAQPLNRSAFGYTGGYMLQIQLIGVENGDTSIAPFFHVGTVGQRFLTGLVSDDERLYRFFRKIARTVRVYEIRKMEAGNVGVKFWSVLVGDQMGTAVGLTVQTVFLGLGKNMLYIWNRQGTLADDLLCEAVVNHAAVVRNGVTTVFVQIQGVNLCCNGHQRSA